MSSTIITEEYLQSIRDRLIAADFDDVEDFSDQQLLDYADGVYRDDDGQHTLERREKQVAEKQKAQKALGIDTSTMTVDEYLAMEEYHHNMLQQLLNRAWSEN